MGEHNDWWQLTPSPLKFFVPDNLAAIDGRVNKIDTKLFHIHTFI